MTDLRGPWLTEATGQLPLLVSVPHGGSRVPERAEPYCRLSESEIVADGDEGALAIYGGLEHRVAAFVATDVARAIVDINRQEDDRRKDGIVKTHTCWDVPIYEPTPDEAVFDELIASYHRPYHELLTRAARSAEVRFAVDCHTMAAEGPPVGPDPGVPRPMICLGNVNGTTCSDEQLHALGAALEAAFRRPVSYNVPFSGGHNVRAHYEELPWVQLELSRSSEISTPDKAAAVSRALDEFCRAGP